MFFLISNKIICKLELLNDTIEVLEEFKDPPSNQLCALMISFWERVSIRNYCLFGCSYCPEEMVSSTAVSLVLVSTLYKLSLLIYSSLSMSASKM